MLMIHTKVLLVILHIIHKINRCFLNQLFTCLSEITEFERQSRRKEEVVAGIQQNIRKLQNQYFLS